MKNVLLTISYDGTAFSGWQIQPAARTVQGALNEALSIVCGGDIRVEGASRTDAGVHALGQRATFKGAYGIPVEKLQTVVNRILPEDVMIKEVREVPLDFHARFDACGKTYLYKIRNCQSKDVFQRNFCYTEQRPLDVEAMRQGAAYLTGTHDFKAFMSMGSTPQETTVRSIFDYGVAEEPLVGEKGNMITLSVRGDGFLYNMVRIMTGTLLEVGTGKIPPERIAEIIRQGERKNAGRTAPPQGLYLAEVYFDKDRLTDPKAEEKQVNEPAGK